MNITLFQEEATKQLCSFLKERLPALSKDWKELYVFPNLPQASRKHYKYRKKGLKLTVLDLAALLRIFHKTWIPMSSKYGMPNQDYKYIKEMQALRNKWAHAGSESPLKDDLYSDLVTLEKFFKLLKSDSNIFLIIDNAKRDSELLTDQNGLNLRTYYHRDFQRSLSRLKKRNDGSSMNAFHKAVLAAELWSTFEYPKFKKKPKDEHIDYVYEYILPAEHCILAWERGKSRLVLYVGKQSEAENWLAKNSGAKFAFEANTYDADFIPISNSINQATDALGLTETNSYSEGCVLQDIPSGVWSELEVSETTLKAISTIAYEDVSDSKTKIILNALEYPSEKIKIGIIDAIRIASMEDVDGAIARLNLMTNNFTTDTKEQKDIEKILESEINCDKFAKLSGLSPKEIEHILEPDSFSEWLLFLSPSQKKIVSQEFNGPARIVGVSGSGKTCVLVHRAKHLAEKYHGQKILVLTLSQSLVYLLKDLLRQLCPTHIRSQFDVLTIYDYCYQMIKTFKPKALIEPSDKISGENIDIAWGDFCAKSHAKKEMGAIYNAMVMRDKKIDPYSYIRDELIWVRSGFNRKKRERYNNCDRIGRGITFHKYAKQKEQYVRDHLDKMPRDVRSRILRILHYWEEYMQEGGLLDNDGISLKACEYKNRIQKHEKLTARCVLVDEVQDLSTNELKIIKHIPRDEVDGLFLCGDPVQKVFPKHHIFVESGINIKGRGVVLKKNYRNTKQILKSAFLVIKKYANESAVPRNEIIEPEYAFRDGSKPLLVECDSVKQQHDFVLNSLKNYSDDDMNTMCVCSANKKNLSEFIRKANDAGYKTAMLSGKGIYKQHGLKVALLNTIKGYEFSRVFLMDLSDSDLPSKGVPSGERWRDAFAVYIAMTRARDELIMSFVDNRTILIGPLQDSVSEGHVSDWLP